jgi:hypothetical protein
MKTAIEQMMEDLNDTFPRFFNVHSAEGRVFMGMATKYLSVEKEQAQNYAEFCVMCDRENLPLLDFESYILTYGGNK